MKGLEVVCMGCKRVYHETTEHFNPHVTANGSMVRLIEPYRKWGWNTFGDGDTGLPQNIAERPGIYWSFMSCPQCGYMIAQGGKLTVRHPGGREFVPEPLPEPIDNTVDGKLVFDNDYSDLDTEWRLRATGVKRPDGTFGFTKDNTDEVPDMIKCPKCGKEYANTKAGRVWFDKHVEGCK